MQLCTLKPGKDCCLFHRDLRINLINIKNKLIIFVAVTVLKMLLYVGVFVFWDKEIKCQASQRDCWEFICVQAVCSGSVKFLAAQGKKRLFTTINLPSSLIHSPPQRLLRSCFFYRYQYL